MEESYQQIKLLVWELILFIGLIGLLNIINTTYTNIHIRVNEIGMQRAMGMSTASLYKTFLWEGAYYEIIASTIVAMAGYICTIYNKIESVASISQESAASTEEVLACVEDQNSIIYSLSSWFEDLEKLGNGLKKQVVDLRLISCFASIYIN